MRTFVYRNLHRNGVWYSLRALEGPFRGRVVGHAEGIDLYDVEFVVGEAGRQRVLKTQRKNVHAGVIGNIWSINNFQPRLVDITKLKWYAEWKHISMCDARYTSIKYNPYLYTSFVTAKTNQRIDQAKYARICATGVYVSERSIGPAIRIAQIRR